MEIKLYVGNMSYDTTEDELRTMFSEAGTVGSVDIIKDRDSGTSKGFAFITMNSNQKTVNNRALTVNMARPREEGPRNSNSWGRQSHKSRGGSRNRY
jgi:RNA recognition motif-containing protein